MTLAGAFGSGGIQGLAALNQRLIASVIPKTDASGTPMTDPLTGKTVYIDSDTGIEVDPATGLPIGSGFGVTDPNEDTSSGRPEVRPRFSSADPLEFNRIKEWVEAQVFGGASTGMSPLIGAFINDWADKLAGPPKRDATGKLTRDPSTGAAVTGFPTLEDMLNTDGFLNGALWLPLTANNGLPPVFESSQTAEDGTEQPVVGVADPLTGVEFIEIQPDLAELKKRPQTLFQIAQRGRDFIRRAEIAQGQPDVTPAGTRQITTVSQTPSEGGLRPTIQQTPSEGGGSTPVRSATIPRETITQKTKMSLPDYMKTLILYSDPAAEGRTPTEPLPSISQSDLIDKLTSALGTGGGGGGGAGRRDLVFDRDHLVAQVEDLWRSWMLDPNQPPRDWIGSQVDAYVREARSFWSSKGGQLDFDTYMRDKLKSHPRFQEVYKYLPGNQTPEQFLSTFAQPISQFGQNADFTRQQTFQAITSGAGPAAQLERISRTRQVENAGAGGYSKKLAQTLAGIGVG